MTRVCGAAYGVVTTGFIATASGMAGLASDHASCCAGAHGEYAILMISCPPTGLLTIPRLSMPQ
jgi:hypothetical protein